MPRAGFIYGAGIIWINILNATASVILSAPPYKFSSGAAGLVWFGPSIGASLSSVENASFHANEDRALNAIYRSLISGNLGDWVALREARRKNGVREPEDRLWVLAVCALLVPVGLIIWGVGAQNGLHWIVYPIGFGIILLTSTASGVASINYAVDSYKDLSHDAIVSVIIVRVGDLTAKLADIGLTGHHLEHDDVRPGESFSGTVWSLSI